MSMLRGVSVAILLLALGSGTSSADWNDRTILTFSAPVMVPGATLEPGTYVFELAEARGNRHLVRILDKATGESRVVTQAVPIRRQEVSDSLVLQFNPTAPGSPPAVQAWFFPGSAYGHEFIYPDEQARQIAERTKTVVLSTDVPGTDLGKGELRTYSPSGERTAWQGDATTMREWEAWQKQRGTSQAGAASAAPAIQADFQGTRVDLDDLEDHPSRYVGQRISVDGEVEEIYGPRLFTIDEPNWGDLDGEIMVLVPSPFAALVKDDDRITVTGTVRQFVKHEFENEWGWLGLDPSVEVDVSVKPVLVADRVIGGDDNVALMIDLGTPMPVGTAGAGERTSRTEPMTEVSGATAADTDMVGRHVRLSGAAVTGTAEGGFFVHADGRHLFVLPAHKAAGVAAGDMVAIDGVILRMPRAMVQRLNGPATLNTDVYVYAHSVQQ